LLMKSCLCSLPLLVDLYEFVHMYRLLMFASLFWHCEPANVSWLTVNLYRLPVWADSHLFCRHIWSHSNLCSLLLLVDSFMCNASNMCKLIMQAG
jgi:hypothetical protein